MLPPSQLARLLVPHLRPAAQAYVPAAARACDNRTSMSLESRFRAPDGCPDENVLAGFASGALAMSATPEVERHLDGCAACRERVAELGRPPGSRWSAVAVIVVGAGLVLAGADVVVSRTREPPVAVAATMPEALPLTLEMGSRYEIKVPGAQRVAVGTTGVVDVRVVGEEALSIEPVGPGTIPMRVWTKDGRRRTYTVTVPPR